MLVVLKYHEPISLTQTFLDLYIKVLYLAMNFLIDGQISSFCPDQPGGEPFNPNNARQTHSIFVKLYENIFLGMPKVRAWSIFTLSMP
jgi:hypothetical protein